MISCPACEGTGYSTGPVEPVLMPCPQCKGTGEVMDRLEEKRRRDELRRDNKAFGNAPKWFGAFFGASLALSVILTLAFVALIVAVIIALV